MHIFRVARNLSDGSEVIDIVLFQDGQTITLPAVTDRDAGDLIVKLTHAVTDHTVENVVVS